MNKLFVLILVSLMGTGCIAPVEIEYENTVYIGDSDCDPDFDPVNPSAAYLAGIPTECETGGRITDLPDTLPTGKTHIFLAFGKNGTGTPPLVFGQKYETLIASTTAEVWCVKPVWNAPATSLEHVRAQIDIKCSNVIDAGDYITTFVDPVHYRDQTGMVDILVEIVNN